MCSVLMSPVAPCPWIVALAEKLRQSDGPQALSPPPAWLLGLRLVGGSWLSLWGGWGLCTGTPGRRGMRGPVPRGMGINFQEQNSGPVHPMLA